MSWATRFRLRQFLKGSLWVIPLLSGLLGAALGVVDTFVDRRTSLPQAWQYSPSTATTVLATIVGAMAALTGFIVTVSVLVVQMATGTFSARYMRLWYRDRWLKAVLGVVVGTLTFSFTLLRRVESDFVPNLGVTLAGVLVVVALLLFLVFLDHFLHRLRPVAVAALVAGAGRRSFEQAAADPAAWSPVGAPEGPTLTVHAARAGSIQAVDAPGLARWAAERDSVLVLRHPVGDFVSAGAPLLDVVGRSAEPVRDVRDLLGMVALGTERTIEQDPAFALRIMVDIANRALSPAVNDPTTAVQVMDHLGELLRVIGTHPLSGHGVQRDAAGRVRLFAPARSFEDYLMLAVTEIRHYGAGAVQVPRRLRAMLEDLKGDVLPVHRPAIDEELRRLEARVLYHFAGSVDLDRVLAADRQGIGGPSASGPAIAAAVLDGQPGESRGALTGPARPLIPGG